MTVDAQFWPDMRLFALFLIAALMAEVIWRLTVGRLPEQRPGDVGDLIHHLGTIGCAGAVGLALMCSAFYVILDAWSKR